MGYHNTTTKETDRMPVIYKPKEMQRLSKDVFLIVGTNKSNFLKRSRNMIVLRQEHELSLVNPIRLNEHGAEALERLGSISRVIRLGPTMDTEADVYYRDMYGAEVFAPGKASNNPELPVDHVIDDDTILPIRRSRVFTFRNTAEPEAALLVGDLLITSESLQDQKHNHFVNMPVRTAMKLGGYHDTSVVISPRWRRQMEKKLPLQDDFVRLLRLEFHRLIGASGALVSNHAKEETVKAADIAFPLM